MNRTLQFVSVLVLGIGLLGATSGCGKKVVRGSSGSGHRIAHAALNDSAGPNRARASRGLSDSQWGGVNQETEFEGSGAGVVDDVEISSSDIGGEGRRGGGVRGEGDRRSDITIEGRNQDMLTTPASTSHSRFDSPAFSKGLSPSEAYGTTDEKYGLSNEHDEAQRAALSRNSQRKGVTFSNGLRDIYFEFDSWRLNEESRRTLEANAEWLKGNPHERITIEGHCDERGTRAYNYVLGEKRATMVQQYLSFLGIAHQQLIVSSFGKDKPKCHALSESCFQKNRRAHFASDVNVAVQ